MTAGASRLRVGAIGCGQFMSRQHLQTVARCPWLQLAHLADLDAGARARVAMRYGPERASSDWRAVVADPTVDVVVAGIVPMQHPLIVRACLEAGKPLYIEKPVSPTLEEGLELQALARRTGVAVAVGFNRRLAPATSLLRRAFAAAPGPCSLAYRICDDARLRPPRQRWKLADRLLIEVVHVFDLLYYLTGAEPVSVFATEARPNDGLVTIRYADGSCATVHSSGSSCVAQCKERLEAVLDHGAVEMDEFVEVRAYQVAGLPARTCFAGRPYDDCDNSHVEAFARGGVVAYQELRQRYAAALEASGVLADSGDEAAWGEFARRSGSPPWPQVNYCADKGWGPALEQFCAALAAGARPPNAGLTDINRATACALAARASVGSGAPVRLDPSRWLSGG